MNDTEALEVGGHEVSPEQRTELPCPACGDLSDVYYLGSRQSLTAGTQPREVVVSGWVCPRCESTLEVPDRAMMADSDVTEDDVTVVGDDE